MCLAEEFVFSKTLTSFHSLAQRQKLLDFGDDALLLGKGREENTKSQYVDRRRIGFFVLHILHLFMQFFQSARNKAAGPEGQGGGRRFSSPFHSACGNGHRADSL